VSRWIVGNAGFAHGAEFEIRTNDEADTYVTGVQWAEDDAPEAGCMLSYAEARDAARLIAAAPALLEALEGLVNSLAESDEDGLTEFSDDMVAARAAIAQAKGEV